MSATLISCSSSDLQVTKTNPFHSPRHSTTSHSQPNKANPFARPILRHEPSSFKRANLLPSHSPERVKVQSAVEGTPSTRSSGVVSDGVAGAESAGRARQAWRLLWRGGLEIGKEGWRLEGATFFASLSFGPPTPSTQDAPNPFDEANQAGPSSSPFNALQSADTDLCLSLESMRGRKYLQVRGLVDLPADEVLDGGEDSTGVQVSIAPNAPLLAAYLSGLLCRSAHLSPQGRTLHAVHIGLGDESVETGTGTSGILVYGQLSTTTENGARPTLRLCVGRRKPKALPRSERKVRPGEPLPRGPLFFPTKASKKPPPPFPHRAQSASRSFSRAPSVNSIYQHPQAIRPPNPVLQPKSQSQAQDQNQQRRATEKRQRPQKIDGDDTLAEPPAKTSKSGSVQTGRRSASLLPTLEEGADDDHREDSAPQDEDIFGAKPDSMIDQRRSFQPGPDGPGRAAGPRVDHKSDDVGSSSIKVKKPRVPQQILDNKASVRKQTMLMLEERGIARDHPSFKEVFGMTTKGAYFAFRDSLENGTLDKPEIRDIIGRHLDMYLRPCSPSRSTHLEVQKGAENDDRVKLEPEEPPAAIQAPTNETCVESEMPD